MLQGSRTPSPPTPNVDVAPPQPPLWGGVGMELTTYPHNMALTCRRAHLPTALPEQGILSRKLLQRTMALEKLWSKESLLKSLILVGKASSRSRPHDIGGGEDRQPWPLEHI